VLDVSAARGVLLREGLVVVVLGLLYDGCRRGLSLWALSAAGEGEELAPADRRQRRLVDEVDEGEDQGEDQGGDPGTRGDGDADERHVVVDGEE